MGTLIFYDIKKFLASKKNLTVLIIFVIYLAGTIALNFALENIYISQELDLAKLNYNENQAMSEAYENDPMVTEESKISRRKYIQLLSDKVDATENGNWRTILTIDLEINRMMAFPDVEPYDPDAPIKHILLDKDIEPIYTKFTMTGYNFVRLFFTDSMPFILLLLIFLFSSDALTSEKDRGTFKFLLLQPVKKTKIFYFKNNCKYSDVPWVYRHYCDRTIFSVGSG